MAAIGDITRQESIHMNGGIGGIRMETRQATRLYRDDQGVYHWAYYLNMYKNFSILRMILKAMGIGMLVIGAIIGGALISSGSRAFGAAETIGFIVITVLIILAIVVGCYFLVALIYGGMYISYFVMDDQKISHYQPSDQADKERLIGLVSAAGGAATGNWGLTAAAMTAGGRLVVEMKFDDIRSMTIVPSQGEIRLHSFLTWNTIYVNQEDFAIVAEYLRSKCVRAVIREKN